MSTPPPEFSRPVRVDTLGAEPHTLSVEADEAERAALARRFGLPAIDRLSAELSLTRTGATVSASGTLRAAVTQSCVATGEPVDATIEEPFRILFSPEPEGTPGQEEEVELSESDCDVVFYSGAAIDVGEAVAETLSLSLDPWPRAPGAEQALKEAGIKSEAEAGPFAALAGLKDRLKK
ncbi:MAG: YceD family protein [Sphingomonadales bacterium]